MAATYKTAWNELDRQRQTIVLSSDSALILIADGCLAGVKRGHPRSHCQSPLIPQEQTFRSKFVLSSTRKSFALGLISVSSPTGDGNSTFALQKNKVLKNTAAKKCPPDLPVPGLTRQSSWYPLGDQMHASEK
jgi:hypothetical protein